MRVLKIAGYVCFGLLVTLSLLWWGCAPHKPSDAALELRFKKQQPDLERVVMMSDQDPQMSRIAADFLWKQDNVGWPRPQSEWGISEERWGEYRNIFKRADFGDCIIRWGNDVKVGIWSWGIVPSGVSVSYLHCGLPSKESASQDPACTQRKETGSGKYGKSSSFGYRYKKLTNDWYILEEFN
jgi:hypothetical protein